MSFPAYPEYKDSGVEWLGRIPEHWNPTHLKNLAFVDAGQSPPSTECNTEGYGLPFLQGCAEFEKHHPRAKNYCETAPKSCHENDILLSVRAPVGRISVADRRYGIGRGLCYIRPFTDHHQKYFLYALLYFENYFHSISTGSTYESISTEQIKNTYLFVIPLEEQTAIAAFLGRETGKIDALIAEQEKLLTLLAEKRQATISHAVTRGLNPNAPMKDSGVAWLGKVPAHWEILKGSRIGELFGSDPITEEKIQNDGEVPYIKVGSLSLHNFSIENWNWFVNASVGARCNPRSNFIVFPKRGAAIFTNKVNIVERSALIDPNLMGWKIGEKATSNFIAYLLKVRRLEELADVSTVPQINNKHIAPELFPVPPIPEQRAIVEFLNTETSKLDNLKEAAELAIDLFKERRSALIAAAVTGKIDVRNSVAGELAS